MASSNRQMGGHQVHHMVPSNPTASGPNIFSHPLAGSGQYDNGALYPTQACIINHGQGNQAASQGPELLAPAHFTMAETPTSPPPRLFQQTARPGALGLNFGIHPLHLHLYPQPQAQSSNPHPSANHDVDGEPDVDFSLLSHGNSVHQPQLDAIFPLPGNYQANPEVSAQDLTLPNTQYNFAHTEPLIDPVEFHSLVASVNDTPTGFDINAAHDSGLLANNYFGDPAHTTMNAGKTYEPQTPDSGLGHSPVSERQDLNTPTQSPAGYGNKPLCPTQLNEQMQLRTASQSIGNGVQPCYSLSANNSGPEVAEVNHGPESSARTYIADPHMQHLASHGNENGVVPRSAEVNHGPESSARAYPAGQNGQHPVENNGRHVIDPDVEEGQKGSELVDDEDEVGAQPSNESEGTRKTKDANNAKKSNRSKKSKTSNRSNGSKKSDKSKKSKKTKTKKANDSNKVSKSKSKTPSKSVENPEEKPRESKEEKEQRIKRETDARIAPYLRETIEILANPPKVPEKALQYMGRANETPNAITVPVNGTPDMTIPITAEQKCALVYRALQYMQSCDRALDNEKFLKPYREGRFNKDQGEKTCWQILEDAIHRDGTREAFYPNLNAIGDLTTFAKRWAAMMETLHTRKTICANTIKSVTVQYHRVLVDNPLGLEKRTRDNQRNNSKKSEVLQKGKEAVRKELEEAQAAEESDVETEEYEDEEFELMGALGDDDSLTADSSSLLSTPIFEGYFPQLPALTGIPSNGQCAMPMGNTSHATQTGSVYFTEYYPEQQQNQFHQTSQYPGAHASQSYDNYISPYHQPHNNVQNPGPQNLNAGPALQSSIRYTPHQNQHSQHAQHLVTPAHQSAIRTPPEAVGLTRKRGRTDSGSGEYDGSAQKRSCTDSNPNGNGSAQRGRRVNTSSGRGNGTPQNRR
ncbi:hypothetical protein BJX61DRAFT_130708 [Aspergillus egyptiacus]|nr:hypothetical protein BJX61DRAFT_130708 [Aspergillus egyptiacus]